jgi:hypothetical protein
VKKAIGLTLLVNFLSVNTFLNIPSSAAFTIGCKKVQQEAQILSSRSKSGMELERKYVNMRLYEDAYRFYFKANQDYRDWERAVSKSPKCFKYTDLLRVRNVLKSISGYQTMSSRYGYDIASRNNFGSSDPCFKFLGEDSSYMKCRISIGEREGRNQDYGP